MFVNGELIQKAVVVDDCISCPLWLKCDASRKLDRKTRIHLTLGVGVGDFILKGCPLPYFKEIIDGDIT